jgi:hypothetical protein
MLALLATQIAATAAGYKLADKTGASIAEFRDEIINVKNQVDAAVAALDQVVANAATDPRKSFKAFDKTVPRVDDAAKKAKKRSEDIKARGAAYFKDWEKEMAAVNNPEIKQLAIDRKAKLQTSFDNIKKVMEPVKEQFNPWLSDLKDLQKFLSSDLTVSGIDAARDLVDKTRADGKEVQQSMDKVIIELNSIVAAITPAKVAPKK